ncbi:PREDICTED: cytochrome b-c1 complex subunit 9 [Ceratotherium simum simum]|uniref:Cytochrome b-c1 complex subunit 9 n=1 Tax=Ceratotherium simum simum TaxID=73337 RepID=A0ABM0HM54_CERSS|nr:PREDICTED: cytochrome b-c1 complex subunit 9 [Ceratotherium simum simum]
MVGRGAGAVARVRQWKNMAAPTLTARLYSLLFRKTSTFALTIAVGAVFFERAFDQGADAIYEHMNQGKLWKHIKHKYENKE